jgi:hypothetical protein
MVNAGPDRTMLGRCVGTVRLLSLRAAGGTQRCIVYQPSATAPDHQIGISSAGALVENATSLSISSALSPLRTRM